MLALYNKKNALTYELLLRISFDVTVPFQYLPVSPVLYIYISTMFLVTHLLQHFSAEKQNKPM